MVKQECPDCKNDELEILNTIYTDDFKIRFLLHCKNCGNTFKDIKEMEELK